MAELKLTMQDIRWNALQLMSYRRIRTIHNHGEQEIRDWIRQKEEDYWFAVYNPDCFCKGCGSRINPDCCGCGTTKGYHNDWDLGHSFVPIGCNCFRVDS